jgi:glycosyltransferase involved in cell wall biosynthesis
MADYIKINGEWKEVLDVYRKIDGQWVLQTDVQSSILQSNIYFYSEVKIDDEVTYVISGVNEYIGKSFNGYSYDFDCPGILFKGSIDHRSLPEYLNAADIFVLPTQKEGCSNAIVEALAVGLPVVSSNGSFNDDILDSQNSLRINPDSVNEIKESILTLKNNEKLREHMRCTSERRHDSYSLDARAQKILTFLERMYIQ